MNEETLEEAAKKIYLSYENNDLLYGHSEELQLAYKAGIVDGAKWQQERMYSEEEVYQLLYDLSAQVLNNKISTPKLLEKWFEQFKKK
jgi:hypothetical protein